MFLRNLKLRASTPKGTRNIASLRILKTKYTLNSISSGSKYHRTFSVVATLHQVVVLVGKSSKASKRGIPLTIGFCYSGERKWGGKG